MDRINLDDIFNNSFFLVLRKDEFCNDNFQEILKKLKFENDLSRFHPDRLKEYQFSRIGIHQLFKEKFQLDIVSFKNLEDRSPHWPDGFIGSISHCKDLIIVAISHKNKILGVDIENLGRIKSEMDKYILTDKDLKIKEGLTENELKTLIFSAKEALYKALYPQVKKYFGFEYAYVDTINVNEKSFIIRLAKDLNKSFGISSKDAFRGRFYLSESHCLVVIEE